MNWHLIKLQIIELLDRHKRITAVADELELKQPTVSFHMKNMEKELGVQLFYAKAGKVHLTEAGQALRHYAVKINALAREAERVVKEFDERGSGSLAVGASYVPGTYVLPAVLSGFSQRYPHLSLTLTIRPAPVIQQMLLAHEIDIGVLSAEPFSWAPLIGETLCEDELVCIFSPQHRLASSELLYPEQLQGVPFILHGQASSTRSMTLKWAKDLGIALQTGMEMDSLEAIKKAVLSGESVSFISRAAIMQEVERGELLSRPIPQNPYKRYMYVAFNEDRVRSTLFERFRDYLREGVRML